MLGYVTIYPKTAETGHLEKLLLAKSVVHGGQIVVVSTNIAVQFEKVGFSYGKREVFRELTTIIKKGGICGILGANGAGKTTAMRLLVGLLRPTKGSITVLGEELRRGNLDRIGYMPQLNALYQELSVTENVHFFARMYGLSSGQERTIAVDKAISLADLNDRRRDSVSSLSGGMKHRVSLAVALVHSPELLVLDEPTVGLDPQLRASFWEHFVSLADSGVTILISSHTMDDANHCHRLIFLEQGHIVADGSPDELRAAVGSAGATLEDAFLHFVLKESQ